MKEDVKEDVKEGGTKEGVPPFDLCIYVAGADPYENDTLGGLKITKEGLRKRDEKVFEWCRERGIAVAVVLAGGYPENVEDCVDIHWNTFDVGRRVMCGGR